MYADVIPLTAETIRWRGTRSIELPRDRTHAPLIDREEPLRDLT